MDDAKNNSVGLDSLANEWTDNEEPEAKEEKQPSHLTLDKKEMNEKDENNQLLRRATEPEALESVHKYATRIKSFLGWEPLLEKYGSESIDSESVGSDSGDKHRSNDEIDSEISKLVVNENEELDINLEKEKATNKEDSTTAFQKETNPIKSSVTCCTKDDTQQLSHRKYDVCPERENDKSDSVDVPPENGTLSNEPAEELISEFKGDKEESYEKDPVSLENNFVMSDLIRPPPNTPESDNSEALSDTEDSPKKDPDTNAKIGDDVRNDCEGGKDSISNNSECEVDLIEKCESPKTNEALQLMSSENSVLGNISEIDDIHAVSPGSPCLDENSDEKTVKYAEKEPTMDLASTEIVNNKAIDENQKDQLGNRDVVEQVNNVITESVTTEPEEEKRIQPENVIPFSNVDDQNKSANEKEMLNTSEDDFKNEDSFYLENNLLRNNIDKPYMDEIRRLSLGIVKNVIESARSSVNEIFANKKEETRERSTSEILDNLVNDSQTKSQNINEINTIGNEDCKLDAKFSSESTPGKSRNSTESIQSTVVNYTVDDSTTCGYGCFKPHWIQKYSRPRVYLTLFSIIGVIHGCYYAYFVSIISTLEKRYAFKTKVSGTLLLADEITPLILGVIVGYIGSRTHRPRMVAIGMFMSAACCFISGLPYLIYGPAKHLSFIKYRNETGPEICDLETESGLCNTDDAPPTLTVVGIFLLASFLKGFATLSYYVIGISYMDDNIKKKNSPMYLAIALALRLLGPLVGFLMSSAFLKFYENPADDPGYGPDDPRWVGAWWIGFFLQGVLLVIFTLPIALFPRRLPGQKIIEKNTTIENEDGFKQVFAGLLSALKRLGSNPVFVLLIVNTNMKIFGHFGHSIMLPKYMENQFRLSASEASLYSGATSITFVMLATIFGGYLIWKFRPRIKVLLAGMIISEIILCVGFLILIIPRCQIVDMVHFGMNDDGLILNNVCNQKCDCSTTSYTPFCGPGGTTYFSPCFAGCTQEIQSSQHKEFRNCSCVSTPADQNFISTISEGVCPDENCWSQALAYLIIYFFLLSISNAFTVAHSMILLRSVHPGDKSIALGTFETFICLFGFIPFPVTFGALVDSACLVWEKSCGETGNCWFYDMEKYSYLLHGVGALFCSFSVMCLIGLYFLSSRVRDLYADEEEEQTVHVTIKLDTVSESVTTL